MKRLISTTIAMMALSTTVLVSTNLPIIGQFIQPVVAQVAAKKSIQLKLSQFKKVPSEKGFKLAAVSTAKPGDVIVYSIAANNISNKPVSKLVLNQKIRPGTVYIMNSATAVKGAELTFSIDGGRTYSARPISNKKPALASSYTNVRWAFTGSVAPQSKSNLSYEVQIR